MVKDSRIDDFIHYCKENGIQLTEQRLAVLGLLRGSKAHPSPEDIYNTMKEYYPTVSLATVYKNLEFLEKVGFARKVNPVSNTYRYDGNTEPHAHFICVNCNRIYDIGLPRDVRSLMPDMAMEGYTILEGSLQLMGICKQCQNSNLEDK